VMGVVMECGPHSYACCVCKCCDMAGAAIMAHGRGLLLERVNVIIVSARSGAEWGRGRSTSTTNSLSPHPYTLHTALHPTQARLAHPPPCN